VNVPWPVKFGALALIWGGSFLLMKVGLEALVPVQIATLRILTGAATVLASALIMGVRLPSWGRVWGHLSVAGFVLCCLPFTLFPLGEERVSSALAGVGNATTPLSAVLFTALLLPSQRADRRTGLAVAAGFLGVVVILQPWEAQGRPDVLGFGMTLLAGASYGLGWTYVKRFLAKDDIGGLGLPAAQLLTAAAQMSVVTLGWWWLHREGDLGRIPAPGSTVAGSGPALWPLVAVLALGVVLASAVVIGRPRRRPRTEPEAAADDDLTSSVPSPTSTRRS
jgi:drug/metabolite transporter (DMT)-like permease